MSYIQLNIAKHNVEEIWPLMRRIIHQNWYRTEVGIKTSIQLLTISHINKLLEMKTTMHTIKNTLDKISGR